MKGTAYCAHPKIAITSKYLFYAVPLPFYQKCEVYDFVLKYLTLHCSPTLGGLKTANLFNYPYDDETVLKADVKKWNRELNKKGIILEIIKQNTDTALIYVYRVNNKHRNMLLFLFHQA